jgi:predicted phage replisome organizer
VTDKDTGKSLFYSAKGVIKMGENKRYYWLKLQENFFEDDTIDFIEGQENGEKYVLFYLKLCLKALKNEGKLIRYVGEMLLPYDDVGIAKLTRTDIDVVRSALLLFSRIGLIKKMDSGEIYLTQLNEMVGTETQKAKYMRQRRLEQKSNIVTPLLPECYTDIELDTDKELKKDCSYNAEQQGIKQSSMVLQQQPFQKPTIKEIADYCSERKNKIDPAYFFDYYETKGWKVGKQKMTDWKACIRNWERKDPAEAPKEEKEYIMVCEICGHSFDFNNDWECPKCHSKKISLGEKKAG